MTQCLHKDITLQSLTSFWSKKGHVIIICQWNMQGSPKVYMVMAYELSKINYFVIQLINFVVLFCSHDYHHEIKHETIQWIKKRLGLDYVHLCLPYYIHFEMSKNMFKGSNMHDVLNFILITIPYIVEFVIKFC